MKRILPLIALTLTGCATDRAYYDAVNAATQAQAQAAKERYAAIAAMANSGGDAAKVAAMFALMQPAAQQTVQIAPQPTPLDKVLQVLQATGAVINPWIAPVMAYKQTQANGNVAIAQAQANRDVMLGSYTAISQVASNIPQPVTTTTNTTNTTTNSTATTNNIKNCSTGAGGAGASGASGGSAIVNPIPAAINVPNTMIVNGGTGGSGAPGGASGFLNC